MWMPWVRAAAPTTQRQASADPRQQKPEEPGGCGDPGWQAGSGAALSAAAQAAVVTWARGVGQGTPRKECWDQGAAVVLGVQRPNSGAYILVEET